MTNTDGRDEKRAPIQARLAERFAGQGEWGTWVYSGDLVLLRDAADELSRLARVERALRDVVVRIRGWDMLDVCADGPFWKRELDAALSASPEAPVESQG